MVTNSTWRRRSGIQLAYPFEEARLDKWQPPYIVQPKYDGERCRAVPIEDGYLLLSSEENPFFSVPHIRDDVDKLRWSNYEFDGELYRHGMSFEQIHSIVGRTRNIHSDHKAIRYHIFDIVDEHKPQVQRLVELNKLSDAIGLMCSFTKVAPFTICETFDDVMRAYDKFIKGGFEGMIVRHHGATYVRHRSIYMMKFKPKKEDVYEIIGVAEEVSIKGVPKNSLGALICQGDDGTPFQVGTGFSRDDRKMLWERAETLIGRWALVQYQHITSAKAVPRFPVFIKIIDKP